LQYLVHTADDSRTTYKAAEDPEKSDVPYGIRSGGRVQVPSSGEAKGRLLQALGALPYGASITCGHAGACILGDVGGDAAGLVMSQQHGQWRISANIPVDCIVDH